MKWTMAMAWRISPQGKNRKINDPMVSSDYSMGELVCWPARPLTTEGTEDHRGTHCPGDGRCATPMLELLMVTPSIRLLAADIDGTLLNPQFQISEADMAALRRAQEEGVEIVLVTGRRHMFALPIAQQLGFDQWVISSNGAITRSLAGETFHRDLLPAEVCRRKCVEMREFRGNTVLTFDTESKGAI